MDTVDLVDSDAEQPAPQQAPQQPAPATRASPGEEPEEVVFFEPEEQPSELLRRQEEARLERQERRRRARAEKEEKERRARESSAAAAAAATFRRPPDDPAAFAAQAARAAAAAVADQEQQLAWQAQMAREKARPRSGGVFTGADVRQTKAAAPPSAFGSARPSTWASEAGHGLASHYPKPAAAKPAAKPAARGPEAAWASAANTWQQANAQAAPAAEEEPKVVKPKARRPVPGGFARSFADISQRWAPPAQPNPAAAAFEALNRRWSAQPQAAQTQRTRAAGPAQAAPRAVPAAPAAACAALSAAEQSERECARAAEEQCAQLAAAAATAAGLRAGAAEGEDADAARLADAEARCAALRLSVEGAQVELRRARSRLAQARELAQRQAQRVQELRSGGAGAGPSGGPQELLRLSVVRDLQQRTRHCRTLSDLLRAFNEAPRSADMAGVSAAYKRAALRFHPDRIRGLPEAQAMMYEEAFKLISRAKLETGLV